MNNCPQCTAVTTCERCALIARQEATIHELSARLLDAKDMMLWWKREAMASRDDLRAYREGTAIVRAIREETE